MEKHFFSALHKIKVSPRSKLYMKNKYLQQGNISCPLSNLAKKLLRKRVKTCDKSKKPRNTAVATYFAI